MYRLVLGGRIHSTHQKSFAQAVEAEDDEAVSRQKESIDVDQANDLSLIVGIERELIMLLNCILVLVF